MSATKLNTTLLVVRWGARIASVALFFFWGAFFIEHLQWFRNPGEMPPAKVIGLVGLHLLMLVGLAVGWRWELAGATLLLGSSVAFFAAVAGSNFLLFTALTNLPTLGWLICSLSQISRKVTPA